MNNIFWFNEISDSDLEKVGRKAVNISKVFNKNLPVPNGFCISKDFFNKFQEETKIKERIIELLGKLNLSDLNSLYSVSEKIQEIIVNTNMPSYLRYEIINAYENMSVNIDVYRTASKQALEIIKAGRETPVVVIRPSLINESVNHQPNILNVKGKEELVKAVQKCWAFLFTPNSLNLKIKNKVALDFCEICVVVQKMVDCEKSGIIYTSNLEKRDKDEIVIEACFGQSEVLSTGSIIPDKYVVEKNSFEIKEKNLNSQAFMLVKDENIGRNVKRSLFNANEQKLNDEEIKKISAFALDIEGLYNEPQEIEFALAKDKIFILQAKPLLFFKEEVDQLEEELKEENVLVRGLNASLGVGKGYVNIINDENELGNIQENQVLVLRSSELVNLNLIDTEQLRKVSGIITDNDTIDSYLAKLSREFGIPCIVSAANSTSVLKQNQFVTIDANTGIVYEDNLAEKKPSKTIDYYDTATEVKVFIDDIEKIKPDSDRNYGVGLLKINFSNYDNDSINYLENEILARINYFKEKPVWYYADFSDLDLLKTQFECIKRLQDKRITNIGVALGNVTEVSALKRAKELFKEINLEPLEEIEFGVVIDTPASSILIKEICEEGVDFVIVDLEKLSKMTLGNDNEYHPAVLRQITNIVKTCRKNDTETSIFGRMTSEPEFIELLIKNGIDSIICDVNKVNETKGKIAKTERKLILNKVREEYHSQQL
ncbi:MAG: PEP/pyruvate-binding domain-containing protein [Nanoarchaeota archaeon]